MIVMSWTAACMAKCSRKFHWKEIRSMQQRKQRPLPPGAPRQMPPSHMPNHLPPYGVAGRPQPPVNRRNPHRAPKRQHSSHRRHSKTSKFKKCLQLAGLLIILSLGTLLYIYKNYPVLNPTPELAKSATNFVVQNLASDADRFLSESILASELDSGKAIAYLDPNRRMAPASLTKMLTVWVALEENDDLDRVVSIDLDVYHEMIEENASMAGFYGNETVTIRDLLYGTMLPSGGEAAGSLAIATSGSEEAFVALMNQKARSIGMHNSHFTNPVGLDHPDQYSTAVDLTKLVRAACQDPDFYAIFSAPSYTSTENPNHPSGIFMENSLIRTENNYQMLPKQCSIVAGKSGITDDAGRCWASIIRKEGVDYVCITLGAPMEMGDPPAQLLDATELSHYLP
ncbi:MAG TPA: D-alanyl-D-alanine carboxypeptidase [Clostridiaceae bacterium]|nr:D-alanyl-D-alanine carboxypeptidase [Clostridiaceae bacterium]